MNRDATNLFESYRLILEKKKGTKKVKKEPKIKEEEVPKSEDNQESVSETGAFLHRLAARLQADQSNSYTNEDIYRIKELARKL